MLTLARGVSDVYDPVELIFTFSHFHVTMTDSGDTAESELWDLQVLLQTYYNTNTVIVQCSQNHLKV